MEIHEEKRNKERCSVKKSFLHRIHIFLHVCRWDFSLLLSIVIESKAVLAILCAVESFGCLYSLKTSPGKC